MSDLTPFSDKDIDVEHQRRHRIRMRFRRAVDLVRDSSPDKKMTQYQAASACEYIAAAMNLSHEQFSDAVLLHSGSPSYFGDWPRKPPL